MVALNLKKPNIPKITATFEQVLFYVDAPEIILLDMGGKSKVVAVATDKIAERGFFGAKVSVAQFRNYIQDRFDLRFLMLRPDRWTWFEFDLPEDLKRRVELQNAELTRSVIDDILPDHGFFARDHSELCPQYASAARDVQRFEVDGQWDMREFGRLHAQISDLYALSTSLEKFSDAATPIQSKRSIMDAFVKPFEGGGSYLGLFRSLAVQGGDEARPGIKAIQWASPGHIDVVGDSDAFEKLISLVDHYAKNRAEIVENYNHLWSYLQENKLLKFRAANFDRTTALAAEIELLSKDLGRILGVTSYSTLNSITGGNMLVAAKVLLAAQRRISRLFEFFAEGRVAVAGVDIS